MSEDSAAHGIPASGSLQVRGVRLEYEIAGAGVPLIWGHGLSMNRSSDAEAGLLDWPRINARVIRYDARGHGLSESTPHLDGYSWAALAKDQLALADALGIGSYVTGGASMGCGTALHAAVIAPGRMRALVLVIPPTAWEVRAPQAAQWRLAADGIERDGVEALVAARAQLELPDPFKSDPVRREQQARATRAWDPSRLALVMRGASTADLPSRAEIARIAIPTLILAWTGDSVHPASTAIELAGLITDARLHVASSPQQLRAWSGLVDEFLLGLPA